MVRGKIRPELLTAAAGITIAVAGIAGLFAGLAQPPLIACIDLGCIAVGLAAVVVMHRPGTSYRPSRLTAPAAGYALGGMWLVIGLLSLTGPIPVQASSGVYLAGGIAWAARGDLARRSRRQAPQPVQSAA